MTARPSLPALTGLRFVAAALVVGYHVHAFVPAIGTNAVLTALGAGYTGVSLFFVLSGFVLAYNYLTPDRPGVGSVRDFLVARFARVYAVYLLCALIAFPLFIRNLTHNGVPGQKLQDGVLATISAITLTQAWLPRYACELNCPGWSLSAEAFFYAAFPLIGLWLARRHRDSLPLIATACWFLSLGTAFAYLTLYAPPSGATDETWQNVLKYNPLVRLPEFVVGVACGLLFLRDASAMRRAAPALTIAVIVALCAILHWHQSLPYPLLHNGLLTPLFALLILALASQGGPVAAILSTAPLQLLGEASFALYLLHMPVFSYFRSALKFAGTSVVDAPWMIMLYLIIVQVLAIAVLRVVEEPARRAIRRRFSTARLAG
jgi:peptidoglycan/LPS O-acetylase OafA/YrhL